MAPLLLLPAAIGCNVFDPLDSPGGDAQLLSAARACFDRGDMTCARENYAKLSSSQADVQASELAFVMLEEAGVSMADFMTAMGQGNANQGITRLAGLLSLRSPGQSKRQAIFNAYLKINEITQSTELKGLVRFVAAFALAAEILGEEAGGDGTLSKTDISASPDTCNNDLSATSCTGVAAGRCTKSSTNINGGASVTITTPTAAQMDGATPTWGQFKGAIDAVHRALTSELNAAGSFNSGSAGFASVFSTATSTGTEGEECFRYLLLNQGAGI